MKKIRKTIIIFALLLSTASFAQLSEPGDGAGGVGGAPGPVGGGAPIGSGLVLLMSLGAAYGGRKVLTNNSLEEDVL